MSVLESLALVKRNKEPLDYETLELFIDDNCDLLFNDYELFDPDHRKELNRKIVSHFLFHEISVTPYARWRFIFNQKLEEIMPYYNQLYAVKFDPEMAFFDTDFTETLDRTVGTDTDTNTVRDNSTLFDRTNKDKSSKDLDTTNSQKEVSKGNNESTGFNSNVPINKTSSFDKPTQSSEEKSKADNETTYTGAGTEKEIRTDDRTTNSEEKVSGTSTSQLDSDTEENYVKHIKGKRGNVLMSEALLKYRQTIMNIDMEIIEELSVMFRFIFN